MYKVTKMSNVRYEHHSKKRKVRIDRIAFSKMFILWQKQASKLCF